MVFLTDDLGWGDLACYGHPVIQTPHLDKFAKQGMRFTQSYSACGVCSPSRSSILTGRTPYRNGVWRWIPGGHQVHLRTSEITSAELLKEKGYETCHVGKWHLNGKFNSKDQPQPDAHGFDHWMATQEQRRAQPPQPAQLRTQREGSGRAEGLFRTVGGGGRHPLAEGETRSRETLFLNVWTHEPHLPIESDPKFMELYKEFEDDGIRQHHGNVTQIDHAFGKLMKALDELGKPMTLSLSSLPTTVPREMATMGALAVPPVDFASASVPLTRAVFVCPASSVGQVRCLQPPSTGLRS